MFTIEQGATDLELQTERELSDARVVNTCGSDDSTGVGPCNLTKDRGVINDTLSHLSRAIGDSSKMVPVFTESMRDSEEMEWEFLG
jgi:hypothetical protein